MSRHSINHYSLPGLIINAMILHLYAINVYLHCNGSKTNNRKLLKTLVAEKRVFTKLYRFSQFFALRSRCQQTYIDVFDFQNLYFIFLHFKTLSYRKAIAIEVARK